MSKSICGIQFIGTQRSGSNLLRVMLEQHPAVAAPHPPHLLQNFVPLLPFYGSLNNMAYSQLVGDMVDYVEANPVPWEGVHLCKKSIIASSTKYNIYEVFRLIYEQAACSKGAAYWCCKSMTNLFYSEQLEAEGMNLKYIFLYRDGRDVALSFKKAIVGDKHVYHLATQWKTEQDICLSLLKQYGTEKVFLLNYEDLVTNPEAKLRTLCHFLGIDYLENMMQFYESSSSKSTAAAGEMWKNLEKPIMKNNTNKYLQELSEEEIEIYEWIAGSTLQSLGYKLSSSLQNAQLLSEAAIRLYHIENEERKKTFLANAPELDKEKRKAQLELLRTIKERELCK